MASSPDPVTGALSSMIDVLVSALTPDQARALLERLTSQLTTRTPLLPDNMSENTAAKLAQTRRATVEREMQRKRYSAPLNVADPVPAKANRPVSAPVASTEPPPAVEVKTAAAAPTPAPTPAALPAAPSLDVRPVTTANATSMFVLSSVKPSSTPTKLANISALCPPNLQEKQTPGFRPYEFLKTRIVQLCGDPKIKDGQAILQRFVFDTKDSPTVRVVEALACGFDPVFVLGRLLEFGTNKLFVGYVRPSETTVAKAWEYLASVISMWGQGLEFSMKGFTHGTRSMTTAAGTPVSTGAPDKDGMRSLPAVQNIQHAPKVYIIRPFDSDRELCVVIA